MYVALPEGCEHLDWSKTNGYMTWVTNADADDLAGQKGLAKAQGLKFVGAPHVCQTDPDSGMWLWAVAVTTI